MSTIRSTIEVFNKGYSQPALRIHATYENLLEAGKHIARAFQWYEEQGCTVKADVEGEGFSHTFENGIISDPGKFEGETIATLYYYDACLNGDGVVFEVTDEERQAFDLDKPFVYLAESNDGFVSLELYDTREQAEEREGEEFESDEEDY